MMRSALAALTLLLAAASTPAPAAPAHEHGVVRLDVAVDDQRLTIALEAPLDSLLGFERAPRTDAERQAAAAMLARLRQPEGLFAPSAPAACRLQQAEVRAPVLEPVAQAAKPAAGDHADLDAEFVFRCEQPAQLAELQVNLFDAFRRIRRIEVQVAGAKAQSKATLGPTSRRVKLR